MACAHILGYIQDDLGLEGPTLVRRTDGVLPKPADFERLDCVFNFCPRCGIEFDNGTGRSGLTAPNAGAEALVIARRSIGEYGWSTSRIVGMVLVLLAGAACAAALAGAGCLRAATIWPPAMFLGG